jgi:hypothetical protein
MVRKYEIRNATVMWNRQRLGAAAHFRWCLLFLWSIVHGKQILGHCRSSQPSIVSFILDKAKPAS